MQSLFMQSDWAAENLQTIRTLMERAAVYRRALAPIMTAVGAIGIVAALIGCRLEMHTSRAFVAYWMGASVVALAAAFLLVRRQAMHDAEPFWSLPTRRVAQALAPSFFAGLMLGTPFLHFDPNLDGVCVLIPAWMILYGCALHSAGFFISRGIKLFGWGFVVCGCGVGFAVLSRGFQFSFDPNWAMGVFFGVGHAACGIYL